jgi:hypothetical protein
MTMATPYIPPVQSARVRSTPIIMFDEAMTFRIRAMRRVTLMANAEKNEYFIVLLRRSLKSSSSLGRIKRKGGPKTL